VVNDIGEYLGAPRLKAEGAPLHPDDLDCEWSSHEAFMKQAKAYYNFYNLPKQWEQFQKDYKAWEENYKAIGD